MNSRSHRVFGAPKRTFEFGAFGIIAFVAITAATAYFVLYPPRNQPIDFPAAVGWDSDPRPVRHREFEALFESNIPLARLARPGRYTVVEVFVDKCPHCRDFEGAFGAFNEQRTDVALFRVHHPGEIARRVTGENNQGAQQQLAALDARMDSYGICATPHVEVYGPNRELLARDSCGARDGAVFMWAWITQETGIEPELPVKGYSSLKESKDYMVFVKLFLGIELAYLLLLAIQGFLNYDKSWWDKGLLD